MCKSVTSTTARIILAAMIALAGALAITGTAMASGKSKTANPANTQATAINLGAFSCVNSEMTVSIKGSNTAGTSAWYDFGINGGCYEASVKLTGKTGDTFNLWDGPPGNLQLATSATSVKGVTFTGGIQHYVQVSGGTAGKQFTLVINTGND